MSKKIDIHELLPSPREIRKAFVHRAAHFMHCPKGHELPYRMPYGRCSPLHCCEGEIGTEEGQRRDTDFRQGVAAAFRKDMEILPRGFEAKAVTTAPFTAEEAEQKEAHAEEALRLMRLLGISNARQALHPLPELPPPPDLKELGPDAYIKKRLADVAPFALEREIFEMRYDPTEKGRESAQKILARAGFGEKKDSGASFSGPVIMLSMPGATPYDAQMRGREKPDAVIQSPAVQAAIAAEAERERAREEAGSDAAEGGPAQGEDAGSDSSEDATAESIHPLDEGVEEASDDGD